MPDIKLVEDKAPTKRPDYKKLGKELGQVKKKTVDDKTDQKKDEKPVKVPPPTISQMNKLLDWEKIGNFVLSFPATVANSLQKDMIFKLDILDDEKKALADLWGMIIKIHIQKAEFIVWAMAIGGLVTIYGPQIKAWKDIRGGKDKQRAVINEIKLVE